MSEVPTNNSSTVGHKAKRRKTASGEVTVTTKKPMNLPAKQESGKKSKKNKKNKKNKNKGKPSSASGKQPAANASQGKKRKRAEMSNDSKSPWAATPIDPKKPPIKPYTLRPDLGYLSPVCFDELGLRPPVEKLLQESDGKFVHLTQSQATLLPEMLDTDENILAFAKPGTGRTLAFLVTMLHSMDPFDRDPESPFAVIMTSDQKRAIHIRDELWALTTDRHPVETLLLTLSRNLENDKYHFSSVPDVIICQPQRLLDHLQQSPAVLELLEGTRLAIVDQFDMMLQGEHTTTISSILASMERKPRVILMSSTDTKTVWTKASSLVKGEFTKVSALPAQENTIRRHVIQEYAITQAVQRPSTLMALLQEYKAKKKEKVLVYFAVAEEAAYYAELMQDVLHEKPIEIHRLSEEKMNAEERQANRKRLQTEERWIAFTTDPNQRWKKSKPIPGKIATVVVHVGAPKSPEMYVKRLGGYEDELVPRTLILGLPFEEQQIKKLAQHFKIPKASTPASSPKLKEKVKEALKKRKFDKASKEKQEEATECWMAWLGYMKSLRPSLGFTTELLVACGNELFGTMYSTSDQKAPPVHWSWACQVGLRNVKSLICQNRGKDRPKTIDLDSDNEQEQSNYSQWQLKSDLLTLVRKLKQGERAAYLEAHPKKGRTLRHSRAKKDDPFHWNL